MKKHFLSILIAAAAISSIFSACNKEVVNSNDSQENSGLVSFVATIDDAATKTTIDGTKVYWKTGDEVCVNGSIFVATVDETDPAIATFNLKDGQTAPAEASAYRFYYPASAYVSNTATQQYKLPATQTYAGEDISAVNPMYAQTTSLEGTVNFKNVCGLLAIDLMGTDKVMSITVTAPKGNYLAGTISNFAYSNDAVSYSSFSRTSSTSVKLNCSTSVQLSETEATRFYIAMPEKTYSALTFEIALVSGAKFTYTTTKAAEIKKSNLYTVPFTLKAEDVEIEVGLYNVSDYNPALLPYYPAETSLIFDAIGTDITSFYYILAEAGSVEEMYEIGYTAKELALEYGNELPAAYLEDMNGEGIATAFEDLDGGTEYALLYYATNGKGGETSGDVRATTTEIPYYGKLKTGEYEMTESFGTTVFSNTFVVNPTTTENCFVVKDLGYENGDGWNAVYDEAAGTLTLDGTQYGYEEDGNYFGSLLYYYDSSRTSAYGVYCFVDENDEAGEGPLVFSVDEDGIIDQMITLELDVPVLNLSDGSLLGYLNLFDSDAVITYNGGMSAAKASSLKPVAELGKTVEKLGAKVNFVKDQAVIKVK